MKHAFHHTQQHTVAEAFTVTGIGLHSGLPVTLTVHPASVNTGIVFSRIDIPGGAIIPASCQLVGDTKLGTTLVNAHGASISTIEHLMAAFWGVGIDNAIVSVDAAEVPILDGSSQPWIDAIASVGVLPQSTARRYLRIIKPLMVEQGESSLAILPADGFSVDIDIEYPHPSIKRQVAYYDFQEESFKESLAEARTFGFLNEVEYLKTIGLARGGSLDNAIVLSESTVLNPEGLRSGDEFVRHKALDCVGDLYLTGYRLIGAVRAVKPGHTINAALARLILDRPDAWEIVTCQPFASQSVLPTRAAIDARLFA